MKNHFSWTLGEKKYLRLDEVKQLRNFCKRAKILALRQCKIVAIRDWFLIELGLNTGLRVDEIRNLRFGDLGIEGEMSSLVVKRGKGGKSRVIRISSKFKSICKWYAKWKDTMGQSTSEEDYLFTRSDGKQLSKRALQKAFKRTAMKAGLLQHYSIHTLRHTYGTHLYVASEHNLRLVQKQLGHSSVRITEVYADLIDSDAKNAIERIYEKT